VLIFRGLDLTHRNNGVIFIGRFRVFLYHVCTTRGFSDTVFPHQILQATPFHIMTIHSHEFVINSGNVAANMLSDCRSEYAKFCNIFDVC
jgi:hypothetical protein